MSPHLWEKGFTLIELMIVIAIVAILVSIAIPMMKVQAEKAKLTELTNSMSATAAAVAAAYQDDYKFPTPTLTSVSAIMSTLGVAIPDSAVSRIRSVEVLGGEGRVTFMIQNVGDSVDGKALILSPSTTSQGAIVWSWGGSAGFPAKYIPTK